MKVKISELEEVLNITRSQLEELQSELKTQKKAIANLTMQVKFFFFKTFQLALERYYNLNVKFENVSI